MLGASRASRQDSPQPTWCGFDFRESTPQPHDTHTQDHFELTLTHTHTRRDVANDDHTHHLLDAPTILRSGMDTDTVDTDDVSSTKVTVDATAPSASPNPLENYSYEADDYDDSSSNDDDDESTPAAGEPTGQQGDDADDSSSDQQQRQQVDPDGLKNTRQESILIPPHDESPLFPPTSKKWEPDQPDTQPDSHDDNDEEAQKQQQAVDIVNNIVDDDDNDDNAAPPSGTTPQQQQHQPTTQKPLLATPPTADRTTQCLCLSSVVTGMLGLGLVVVAGLCGFSNVCTR